MTGCISELTSRRVNFDECKYWSRDYDDDDLEEYTYKNNYSGIFWAKESNANTTEKNVIDGTFIYDESTITIETNDLISIKPGDIVKFEDKLWHVVNVQEREMHKSKQFLKMDLKKTYIQLRR